jgi:protoporphyrinogen oxidase
MFFEDYTEKLWGVHPSKLSADWGAQRVKGVSIKQILKDAFTKNKSNETSLIEEFEYPKYGPGQLFEKMKDEIIKMGGEIIFNEKVEKINVENGKIVSINDKYKGDYFISSMPIKDLVVAIGDTENEIYEDAINLPYRDFITVGILLKKLNIKNKTKIKTINEIVPDNWIYMQERDLKIGRLQIFNNWSPYMVKDIENTVWIGCEYFCNEGDKYWNMPKKEFIKMAINELIRAKVIKKEDVIAATQFKVKKAYPAYFGSYENIDNIKKYLDSFSNLYCVGRNGQHRYNNMDHSMLTSIEAVNLIKENKTDKDILWKVNTEKEYHEAK